MPPSPPAQLSLCLGTCVCVRAFHPCSRGAPRGLWEGENLARYPPQSLSSLVPSQESAPGPAQNFAALGLG